jgi:hypothetical protein
MAMTKGEKAELEAARNALALVRAMHFPDYPVPQPMTTDEIKAGLVDGGNKWGAPKRVARGWFYNVHISSSHGKPFSVTYGCSNGIHHAREGDTTNSQNAGRMYRTKDEALRAARHEATTVVAKVLAAIDEAIAGADE